MIIKAYTNDFPGKLVILDNAHDVIVHRNVYSGKDSGPVFGFEDHQLEHPARITTWQEIDFPPMVKSQERAGMPSTPVAAKDMPQDNFQFIDFTRNGVRTRLKVRNYAYICNDQGITVEKVKAA